MKRRVVLVAVLTLALSLVAASPVLADEVAAHVSSARGDSLPILASTDQVAGTSAAAQAAAGKLFHADLSGLLGPCESVGEVVGTGPDLPSVFAAFRQSSTHWRLVTNPAWTAIGTGRAVAADGMLYVSVVFCRQTGGAPPAVEAPPPAADPGTVSPTPTATAPAEVSVDVPILDEQLPAIGARRAEIRARLDRQARSMLPPWYVGVCGSEDRERVLEDDTSDSGACPKAS